MTLNYSKQILLLLLTCLSIDSIAEKLDLDCSAMDFRVQSELDIPLKPGFVREVSQPIAGFLDSDTWSLRKTIDCQKDELGKKSCLGLNDALFCKNPKGKFRVRSIREDNSVLMIENRCEGGYKKYVVVSDMQVSPDTAFYMEDRMQFKLKNQVHADRDLASYAQPVVILKVNGAGDVRLAIESFVTDHWQLERPNAALSGLKADISYYETDAHDRMSLATDCVHK